MLSSLKMYCTFKKTKHKKREDPFLFASDGGKIRAAGKIETTIQRGYSGRK